jgi:uncharacterized protein with FMN-binding domain
MAQGSNKVSNSLLALSSAAILAVYTAGYSKTRSAADKFSAQTEERRPPTELARVETSPPATLPAQAVQRTPTVSEPKREAAPAPVLSPPKSAPVTAAVPTTAVAEKAAPVQIAEPTPAAAEPKIEPKVEAPAAAPVPTPAPAPAPAAATSAPKTVWKDGTYLGWGTSRHGDIQASVVVENGRISATIAQCFTRYPCSVISMLPPQVAARQSYEVDYVSGSTQSANAFYYAVVDALSKAK